MSEGVMGSTDNGPLPRKLPDGLDPTLWQRFRQWEEQAAVKGSGLTQEQMVGAVIFWEWLRVKA